MEIYCESLSVVIGEVYYQIADLQTPQLIIRARSTCAIAIGEADFKLNVIATCRHIIDQVLIYAQGSKTAIDDFIQVYFYTILHANTN